MSDKPCPNCVLNFNCPTCNQATAEVDALRAKLTDACSECAGWEATAGQLRKLLREVWESEALTEETDRYGAPLKIEEVIADRLLRQRVSAALKEEG